MNTEWYEYSTNPNHVRWTDHDEAEDVADGSPLLVRKVFATDWHLEGTPEAEDLKTMHEIYERTSFNAPDGAHYA